jgi:hypothetical protein
MKKLSGVLAFASVLFLTGAAFAQGVQSDIAVGRADIQADRQAVVSDNMKLNDAQAAVFWPVYRDYRAELAKSGDRLVKLVSDYGANYATLTDAQATAMTAEMISIKKDILKTTEKFLPKFNAVLSPKMVMRYLQIENKLDTILMVSAVDGVPLAK